MPTGNPIDRLPELRVTEPGAHFRSYRVVYGLTSLPVAW